MAEPKKRRRQVSLPSGAGARHNPHAPTAELSDGLRRLKKMRVVNLNQQIAEHAKQKDLKAAVACFRKAEQLGVANDFSFTNLINAHAICGDAVGAGKLLKRMRRAGLAPGVIAYTTVIKAHAGRGDLAKVERLHREMAAAAPPIAPNVRTINTHLRGCSLVGAVAEVAPLLARMRAANVEPDGSTLEYAATLLCQGLRVDEAKPLLQPLEAGGDALAVAAVRLALGRAALVLGQWANARQEIGAFERCLDALSSAASPSADGSDADAESEGGSEDEQDGGGGRRGWRADATRERSAEAFRSHRVSEWRREAAALRGYLQSAAAVPEKERRALLEAHLRRVFFFPLPSESRPSRDDAAEAEAQGAAAQLGAALCERLGAAIALPACPPSHWVQAAAECLDDQGRLDFGRIFVGAQSTQGQRPVHLEVGSGGGEWACALAAASPGVNWLTLELRGDRVYHTFLQALFGGVGNLCAVGGDVHSVARRLAPGSIAAIFVNHPEPPQQYDDGGGAEGGGKSDGEHMLTAQFFAASYRALRPGGRLTIVTDNQHYGRLLLSSVGALSDGGTRHFRCCKLAGGDGAEGGGGYTVEAAMGELSLYRGQPGEACGHAAVASSYFDRLWRSGASKSASATARYLLCLRREGPAPVPVGAAAAEAAAAEAVGEGKKAKKKKDKKQKKKSKKKEKHRKE